MKNTESINVKSIPLIGKTWLIPLSFVCLWAIWVESGFSIESAKWWAFGLSVVYLAQLALLKRSCFKNWAGNEILFWICILGLSLIWSADMEWPGDNWTYWGRPKSISDAAQFSGIGEFLNLLVYDMWPDKWWHVEPGLVGAINSLLILSQLHRLSRASGIQNGWLKLAVISGLLSWGVYGFPLLRQIILGQAALSFAAQLALFTEAIFFCKTGKVRSKGWLVTVIVAIFYGHDQSVIMSVIGVSAIVCWGAVLRFGWTKAGVAFVVVGALAWAGSYYIVSSGLVDLGEVHGDYLNQIGGFSFHTPLGKILWMIPLGLFGLVGLACSIREVMAKRVTGFLFLFPSIFLSYPPTAQAFFFLLQAGDHPKVFSRVLLILPSLLPVISLLQHEVSHRLKSKESGRFELIIQGVALSLIVLVGVVPEFPFYGKTGHYLARNEQSMEPYDELVDYFESKRDMEKVSLLSDKTTQYVLNAVYGNKVSSAGARETAESAENVWEEIVAEMGGEKAVIDSYDIIMVNDDSNWVSREPSFMTQASNNVVEYSFRDSLSVDPVFNTMLSNLLIREGWTETRVGRFLVWEKNNANTASRR